MGLPSREVGAWPLGSALLGRSQLVCKDQTLVQQQWWAWARGQESKEQLWTDGQATCEDRLTLSYVQGPAPHADHRARWDPRAGSSRVLGSQSPFCKHKLRF